MSGGVIIDLGDWAEDKFSGLCSRAGVTRNKSIQDRTGWDYLIEFPRAQIAGIPADLQPVEKSARVQVKSKRSGKAFVKLKLSNALRFAKDPLPCFVVLFLATQGGEPVRVFARHFWTEEMTTALLRAREAHAGGRDDLNNLTMTLSFGPQDEHDDDLLDWMTRTIDGHGDRFAEKKAHLVQTLGFEDGAIHGKISYDPADLEALVDHQIGLTPAAPAVSITVRERRFGIDSATPLFDGTPTFAHVRSHPKPCRLRVRGVAGDDEWLEGKLYLPAFADLPLELRKLRVVADFIEILIESTKGGNVTFHLDGNTQRSLPSLRALANVLGGAEEGPLQFQVSTDDMPPLSFTVSMPGERSSDELQQLSNVIACLEKASRGLLPGDLTLSLAEIDDAWNAIAEFNGLISGADMKGTFRLDRDFPTDLGPVSSLFLFDYVDIGAWTFMTVVRRPILRFDTEGAGAQLVCGDPRVVEAFVRQGHGSNHLGELRNLYAQAVQAEPSGVLEFYEGDYRAMTAGKSETAVRLRAP